MPVSRNRSRRQPVQDRLTRLLVASRSPAPTGDPESLAAVPMAESESAPGAAAPTAAAEPGPAAGTARPGEVPAGRSAASGEASPTPGGSPPPLIRSEVAPVDVGVRNRLAGRLAAAFGLGGARIDPGGSGIRALAVVAALVVVAAAGVAWWAQPRAEPVATADPAPPLPSTPSASGVVVAVAGKVRRPGLVALPAGARVADAIEAAGGVLPGTDIGYLNLARKVTDGELIVVGGTPPPDAAGGAAAPGDPAGKVNLNTATLQELDSLPGVGPVLAQRILDYRDEHGGFRSVDELRKVDGIGPTRYEELKDLVTV